MYEIPIDAVPSQQFLVTLEGQDCIIDIYQRKDRVFMDLTADGRAVRRGAVCLPRVAILQGGHTFNGNFFFVDTRSPAMLQEPPQWRGLGTRYRLYYITKEELAFMQKEREEQAFEVANG